MSKKQSNSKSNKADNQVSPTMSQLVTVLQEIENMKQLRNQCASDSTLSATDKKQRLAEMDEALFLTEHFALKLMQDEIQNIGDSEVSDASFQWTDPETSQEAWEHVHKLLAVVSDTKAKIAAIEIDPKLPLSLKAEKVSALRECIAHVQHRVVDLSEAWLECEAA